jgi:hypothetical protein
MIIDYTAERLHITTSTAQLTVVHEHIKVHVVAHPWLDDGDAIPMGPIVHDAQVVTP